MKIISAIILSFTISFLVPAHFAYAYGGGGGGGGGAGGAGDLTTTRDRGDKDNSPDGYVPIDPSTLGVSDLVVEQSIDTSSVARTEPLVLTGESVYDLANALAHCEGIRFAVVVSGGILVGYATGGCSIYIQAAASGGYSMAVTHIDNTGKPANEQSSSIYSGVKDTAIAFIPVPPPAQAAISIGVDKGIEVIQELPSIKNPSTGPGGFTNTFNR